MISDMQIILGYRVPRDNNLSYKVISIICLIRYNGATPTQGNVIISHCQIIQ